MYWNRFDIVQAHYWHAVHNHSGMGSDLYAKQCRIGEYYTPGRCENGPTNENALAIYDNLRPR